MEKSENSLSNAQAQRKQQHTSADQRSDNASLHSAGVRRQTPGAIPTRRFLGSESRIVHSHVPQTQTESKNLQLVPEEQSMLSDMQDQIMYWGTNIKIDEIQQSFTNFLKQFKFSGEQLMKEEMEIEYQQQQQQQEQQQEQISYMDRLQEMMETDQFILNIDGEYLFQFDKNLYRQLINFPTEILPLFDRCASSLFQELVAQKSSPHQRQQLQQQQQQQQQQLQSVQSPQFSQVSFGDLSQRQIQIGMVNLKKETRMRQLCPEDVNHLISLRGIVIRCSDISPEMKDAVFKCQNCGKTEAVAIERGRIMEPVDCSKCRTKYSFEIIHNLCFFMDKQIVKLQEMPENVPDGESPQTLSLIAYDDYVDAVKPGDRIEVTGIYRAQGRRVAVKHRTLKSVFQTYLDVISFNKKADSRYSLEEDSTNLGVNDQVYFSEDLKAKLFRIAEDQHGIYDQLVRSFAPSIWENEDIKKGILCQLFGGTVKEFSQSGKGRLRAEINLLLVGDPSTAKSQLLQQVHKISPRGLYTSGKGTSAVGLTAVVNKDPETKELVLQSGALVLSDKGICCIDEFDKMDQVTRTILHEAMEQQTISVAKAGIVCTLNSRTAILASANPVASKYDPKRSVISNINLPPTLLSRFDLIYLLLDTVNEAKDRRLASHILSLYSSQSIGVTQKPPLDKQTLTQYITFAKQFIHPQLTEQAGKTLVDGYIGMRRLGMTRHTISATPRQLESLIRIAEALAKMRLSQEVTSNDVEEAIRLMQVATQQAVTDPVTGQIDIDMITTGITAVARQKAQQIVEKVNEYLEAQKETIRKTGVGYATLFEAIEKMFPVTTQGGKEAFTEGEFQQALKELEDDGYIIKTGNIKRPIIKLGAKFIEFS